MAYKPKKKLCVLCKSSQIIAESYSRVCNRCVARGAFYEKGELKIEGYPPLILDKKR